MKTRADRRNAMSKAKQKAKRLLKSFGFDATPQQVGRWAGTHCRPCSCVFCSSHWDGVFRFKGIKTHEKDEV